MIDNNTLVKVTNRSRSIVGYQVPEMHIVRRFSAGETKEITVGELRALSYVSGGKSIINNHLIINNEELVNEIIYDVQPEYFYTEADIKNVLLKGTIDQLIDTIEFGKDGVKSLVKDLAVKLEINDVHKREIIREKLGFDVTKAIEFNRLSEIAPEPEKTRRAAPITETSTSATEEAPVRRAAPPKYKVVGKE